MSKLCNSNNFKYTQVYTLLGNPDFHDPVEIVAHIGLMIYSGVIIVIIKLINGQSWIMVFIAAPLKKIVRQHVISLLNPIP